MKCYRRSTDYLLTVLTAMPVALGGDAAAASESQCFGTVSNGRIERSVKLPTSGPNFTAYSTLAATAGRTHVHSKVAEVIVESYAALQADSPGTNYVYGETGWPSGGRSSPIEPTRMGSPSTSSSRFATPRESPCRSQLA